METALHSERSSNPLVIVRDLETSGLTRVQAEALARCFNGFATKEDLKGFATKEDLKRFATKEDLKGFATKEDLERFATKEDLKGFATKEDLERFATKEDLKRFATKEDLHQLELRLEARISVLEVRMDKLEDRMDRLEDRMEHLRRDLGGKIDSMIDTQLKTLRIMALIATLVMAMTGGSLAAILSFLV